MIALWVLIGALGLWTHLVVTATLDEVYNDRFLSGPMALFWPVVIPLYGIMLVVWYVLISPALYVVRRFKGREQTEGEQNHE